MYLNVVFLKKNQAITIYVLNSYSLDKALHSTGIGSGFIILGTNLTNPLNMLLPVLQTVSKSSVQENS